VYLLYGEYAAEDKLTKRGGLTESIGRIKSKGGQTMKKLAITFLICLVLALGISARADEVSEMGFGSMWIEAQGGYNVFMNSQDIREWKGGYHFEAKVGMGDQFSIYIPLTYDTMYRTISGQRAGDFSLYGIGVGIRAKLSEYISFWIQPQYFHPISTMAGHNKNAEAHVWYWKNWQAENNYPLPIWGGFDYKVNGGFGGTVGADIHGRVWKNLYVGGSVAYRFIQLEERWKANDGQFLTKDKANLSSVTLGVSIEWRF
jgi:hypothetical protein